MALLHTVNKSPPSSDVLATCLEIMAEDDLLLLIEDGVHAAAIHHPDSGRLQTMFGDAGRLFALLPDLRARGVAGHVLPCCQEIDHAGFVDLCTRVERVVSWF